LPAEDVYKAGPRDGVWATAPFIHNGSVPNLYEMLIPAAECTKKFYLGADFDPVKVGLDTKATSGTFLMDTTLPGNSNGGHSFEIVRSAMVSSDHCCRTTIAGQSSSI
jgi:hypothetical protein